MSGTTIHSVMPEGVVAYLHVRLASMPPKEAGHALRWQAASALDADEADTVCASVPLGHGSRDYFVAGTTSHDLDAHRGIIRSTGSHAGRVDAAPLALCHALPVPLAFIIDVASSRPALLVARDGNMMFYRGLDPSDSSETPDAAALGQQVEQCRQFLGERTDVREARGCILGAPDTATDWHERFASHTRLGLHAWHDLAAAEMQSLKEAQPGEAYHSLIAAGLVLDGMPNTEYTDAHRPAA